MSIPALSPAHVFGLKSCQTENLAFIDENVIVFSAGCNFVTENIETKTQKLTPISDHGEGISCLSVSPDKSLLAVSEKGKKPTITIHDSRTLRKKKSIQAQEGIVANEFISMSFSTESRYIAAQSSGPEWLLHYFSWEKGKILATVCSAPDSSSSSSLVKQIAINPFDSTRVTVLGDSFMSEYQYSDGVLSFNSRTIHPYLGYQAHCWMTRHLFVIVTQLGTALLIEHGKLREKIDICPGEALHSVTPLAKGFACGGENGRIYFYEGTGDSYDNLKYFLKKTAVLPEEGLKVGRLLGAHSEAIFLVHTNTNQLYQIGLHGLENRKDFQKAIVYSPAFHQGEIHGLDVCSRKSLIVTCGSDKQVKIWDFIKNGCEVQKVFSEDPLSVAIHPSGLFILIGFSDKLRLMSILIDDLRSYKEFGIKGCKQCRFSRGGQFFAAVNGNTIQIFSTWSFENIGNLKGHNGRIRSLHWSEEDAFLVSAGTDGAIYTWNILNMKRENEHILKGCSYYDAICDNSGTTLYATGSDKMLKKIVDSNVNQEVESNSTIAQLALSHGGKMFFAGMENGRIRAFKFPISGSGDEKVGGEFLEHVAHDKPINSLRLSYDDQFLFSCSEDGCIYIYKVTEKEERPTFGIIKKDRTIIYSDEILVTKTDIDEIENQMIELKRNIEELKLEHEYQFRIKDMSFNEKMREVTERNSQEVDALKISCSLARADKDKLEVKHQEEMLLMKTKQIREFHDLEAHCNTQLIDQYEKFQDQQEVVTKNQEVWQKEITKIESENREFMTKKQAELENRLQKKLEELEQLKENYAKMLLDHSEIIIQNEADFDTEIELFNSKYEKRLRIERDEEARLKGENGIMRKKFSSVAKDIEENVGEIQRMKDDQKKAE